MLSSFGKDSLLMLALAREVRKDFAVIWFRNGLDETFARWLIKEWKLTVFSWLPADAYILISPEGEQVMIGEYSFGNDLMPMLTDLSEGTKCSLKLLEERTPQLYPPFDLILWGAKDADRHWIKGDGVFKEDGFMLGRARVIAPLRHMTDDQVRAALLDMKVPYSMTSDELPLCTACMTANTDEVYCPELGTHISRHQWESDKALASFRHRFGLEVVDG